MLIFDMVHSNLCFVVSPINPKFIIVATILAFSITVTFNSGLGISRSPQDLSRTSARSTSLLSKNTHSKYRTHQCILT